MQTSKGSKEAPEAPVVDGARTEEDLEATTTATAMTNAKQVKKPSKPKDGPMPKDATQKKVTTTKAKDATKEKDTTKAKDTPKEKEMTKPKPTTTPKEKTTPKPTATKVPAKVNVGSTKARNGAKGKKKVKWPLPPYSTIVRLLITTHRMNRTQTLHPLRDYLTMSKSLFWSLIPNQTLALSLRRRLPRDLTKL